MKKLILVGLSLIIATSLWGADKKVYRLKLAQTYELSMPIVGDVAKRMAVLADSMSDGRLKSASTRLASIKRLLRSMIWSKRTIRFRLYCELLL